MASASLSRGLRKLNRWFSLPKNGLEPSPLLSSYFITASAVSSASESQSASSFRDQEKRGGSRWSKWLLFLPGVMTFGLGTWQIFRRQEKVSAIFEKKGVEKFSTVCFITSTKMKMLEYRRQRLELEPLNLNSIIQLKSDEKLDSLEFRRIIGKGVFDEEKSIYLGPRSRSISGVTENGYYVITPLMPIANNPDSVQLPILVNRGWVPRSWKGKPSEIRQRDGKQASDITLSSAQNSERSSWWKFWSKHTKNIKDEAALINLTEIVGVVRESEKPSIFVPENDPISGQWFYVNVPAMARASGLPKETLYVEDVNENVTPSNPYPLPKDVNSLIRSSVMPQDHLNYTLTWYSLSAAVTFMAFKRLKTT